MIVGIIALLFGLLNMPAVQEKIKDRVVQELTDKLQVELGIEELHIQPFNTVELNGIYLFDRQNEEILRAEKLYASISLTQLLLKKSIVITSVRLSDFDVNLSKETSDSPLNIQFIIDAFKPAEDSKKSAFEIKINSINIHNGNFRFDIQDQPLNNNSLFDRNHIRISDFDSRLALKSLVSDSLNIQIKSLSLKEKSGFTIDNLTTRIISKGNEYSVRGFKLETPQSLLQFGKCEVDVSKVNSPEQFADSAILSFSIVSSYITPKDISPFSEAFRNFSDRIYLKSDVFGTLNNLNVSNLSLDYGDKMQLTANALISNLTRKDEIFLSGSISKLEMTSEGIKGLINNFSSKPQEIPKEVANLGTVSFNGKIGGYLKNLNANGLLKSKLGEVRANLLFGFNTESGLKSFFDGRITSNNFKLGQLVDNDDLDELSFDLSVDLKKPENRKLGGLVKGNITHLDYKGYTYNNIVINGGYDGLKMEGELVVEDENVFLDIDGLFDLSQEKPVLNFEARLRNFQPDNLNLIDKYTNSYLFLDMNANFTGDNIDNAVGYIEIDSLRFYKENDHFFLDNLTVEASGEGESRMLTVKSDILNGEATGEYSFSTIFNSFKQTFQPYLPALVSLSEKDAARIKDNNVSLNFTIGNTEQISRIFSLPFVIYSEAKIIGFYNNVYEKFRVEIFYPSGNIGGIPLKSGYVLAENSNNQIKSTVTGLFTGKNNVQNDVSIQLTAADNTLDTQIELTNDSKQTFRVSLGASTKFMKENKNEPLITEIEIQPRTMVISDTVWQVEKSNIIISPDYVSVSDFNIHNSMGSQSIDINGNYSKKDPDALIKVALEKIDLEYVFNTLAIDALNFGGYATGELQLSNIDGNPYPYVNLEVDGFRFNQTPLGHLKLFSELDNANRQVSLNGTIIDDTQRLTEINGHIDPAAQQLSLNFDADKVNIGFLNKYAATLFNNISGQGTGSVHLYGNFSKVTVEGKAFIENGRFGINFLNTEYSFTDTVYLKNDLIYFNDITLHDPNNNTAMISGKVAHDYFADFMYYMELKGQNFMLYNATERQNPLFFGKVFATGTGSVSGDEEAVSIDARLRSDRNTLISMNFMDETVEDYSFITYKDRDSTGIVNPEIQPTVKPLINGNTTTESEMDITMNLYVDATPDATVEIVMDPVGGDKLRCSGNGALQFEWNMKSSPRLYGTYTITRGSYNFTFQKIIERRFSIQEGSNVLFRGDPFQANLDVSAVYRVNANLKDLDETLARSSGQMNVPVDCILNITGELQHPNVGMEIILPNADGEVQRQVRTILANEDISRQMAYLLLLSKFYTPSFNENRSNDFASLASATLSTQLTKALSSIDDRWQFGTNIRTSDEQLSDTQIELLLSSKLFDDRVLINGSFGYLNTGKIAEAQYETMVRDIDIEILLNRAGTWRLKAYNHLNEKSYIHGNTNSAMQTQGLGIMYKKDFDSLSEIFNYNPGLRYEKTDTIQPVIPDSTVKGSALGEFIRIKE